LERAIFFSNLCFAAKVAVFAAFSRFAMDDFCVIGMVEKLGLWGSQKHWYLTWIGRWMATWNESLFGWLAISSGKSTVVVLIGVALNWLALSYLCKVVFMRRGVVRSGARAWNWAGLALTLLFLATPNAAQSWYWLSGTITYAWPLAGVFATIAYVLDPRPVSRGRGGSFFLVGAAVAGSNEAVAAVLILLLASAWVWIRFRRKDGALATRVLWPLVGTVLSFAMVAGAPGNAIRRTELAIVPGANPLPFFDAILASFPNAFAILEPFWRHKREWFLVGCAAVLALPGKPPTLPKAFERKSLALSLAVVAAIVVGNAILVFPGALVVGSNLPDRVWISNSLWTMAVGAWGFAVAARSASFFPEMSRRYAGLGRKILIGALIVLALYNVRFTYRRWNDVRTYAAAYDAGFRQLREEKEKDRRETLVVSPLPFTNEYMRVEAFTDGCVAQMLGLDFSVTTDQP
jgi:hypothetical protein